MDMVRMDTMYQDSSSKDFLSIWISNCNCRQNYFKIQMLLRLSRNVFMRRLEANMISTKGKLFLIFLSKGFALLL